MDVMIRLRKDTADKAIKELEALGFVMNQGFGKHDDSTKPGFVLVAGTLPAGETDSASAIDGVDGISADPTGP